MEPFTIEMPGPDRLWTVTFTARTNAEFIADATSGDDTRRSRWRISPAIGDELSPIQALVPAESRPEWFPDLDEPEAIPRWLLQRFVRLYRERLDEVVARDGYDFVSESMGELIGPQGSSYLDQIEREIAALLFQAAVFLTRIERALAQADGALEFEFSRPTAWSAAKPQLRHIDDPDVSAALPALDEFYDAYAALTGPSPIWPVHRGSDIPARLRALNSLGCYALRKLATVRSATVRTLGEKLVARSAPPGFGASATPVGRTARAHGEPLVATSTHLGLADHPRRAWWLRTLALERFKAAFEPGAVELTPFTVIIGRNGSGKSTLLQALQWLDTALRQDIAAASDPYYGLDDLIHLRGRDAPPWFGLQLGWTTQNDEDEPGDDELALDYSVRVAAFPEGPGIAHEWLGFRASGSHGNSVLSREAPGHRREILELADTRGQFYEYDLVSEFWDRAVFLRLCPSRLAQTSPPRRKSFEPLLDEEGEKLPTLLGELDDEQRAELIAMLDEVLSIDVQGLDVSPVGPGGALTYGLQEGIALPGEPTEQRALPSWMLSEGTRRLTALFALLCHDPPPSLLCIEEIENGLDPWTAGAVLKYLQSAVGRGTQVIVTTHSPWLLDDVPLDCILQARRVDGVVSYERFASRPEVKAYDAASIPPGTRFVNELE